MDTPEADVKDKEDPKSDAAEPSVQSDASTTKVTLVPSTDFAQRDVTEIKAPTLAEESAALKKVAARSAVESTAAAQRLEIAQAKLKKVKADFSSAADIHSLTQPAAQTDAASPDQPDDIDTEIDLDPPPLRPSLPDPLSAAEQALAMAARARGVPLELPSRLPPDRSDPFAAATRALETARLARGGAAKSTESETVPTSSRHRDPFKAAEAALERAAAVRAEIGVSPEQEQRESAARAELARLRRVKPTSDDDATPTPKKRDL